MPLLRWIALAYLEGLVFQAVDWYIKEVRNEFKKQREKRLLGE